MIMNKNKSTSQLSGWAQAICSATVFRRRTLHCGFIKKQRRDKVWIGAVTYAPV